MTRAITSILMALAFAATILACQPAGGGAAEGHGFYTDASGNPHEFFCSGGPVPEGGLTYATTDPQGSPRCIRPPSPSP